jgi:glutaredoxin-like protein NrdH
MTAKVLTQNGTDYNTIDVSADQAAFDKIVGLGYRQVPVVMANEQHWSGFNPEKLKQLAI